MKHLALRLILPALLAAACAEPAPATGPATFSRGSLGRRAVAEGPALTVATYNVNLGMVGDAPTLAAIGAARADVVFLQETTEAWEASIRREFAATYPHMAFRHCCRAGGLAVLSKYPFEEKAYLEPPEGGWFPAWLVVLETPFGKLQALNVHLRPQLSESGSYLGGVFTTPSIRRAEIEAYFVALDPGLLAIVAGDFNENGRGQAIRFLEGKGYRSALPESSGATPTWRWQTSFGQLTEQLDHVVVDDRLEVTRVEVLEVGRSDHMPVVVTLRSALGE